MRPVLVVHTLEMVRYFSHLIFSAILVLILIITATFYSPGLGACGQTNGPNDFIAAASYKLFDSFP